MSRPFLSYQERSAFVTTVGSAIGALLGVGCVLLAATLVSYSGADPTRFSATTHEATNALGNGGAEVSDDLFTWLGYSAYVLVAILGCWSTWLLIGRRRPARAARRALIGPIAVALCAAFLSAHGGHIAPERGLGGILGDRLFSIFVHSLWFESDRLRLVIATLMLAPLTLAATLYAVGGGRRHARMALRRMTESLRELGGRAAGRLGGGARISPVYESVDGAYPQPPRPMRPPQPPEDDPADAPAWDERVTWPRRAETSAAAAPVAHDPPWREPRLRAPRPAPHRAPAPSSAPPASIDHAAPRRVFIRAVSSTLDRTPPSTEPPPARARMDGPLPAGLRVLRSPARPQTPAPRTEPVTDGLDAAFQAHHVGDGAPQINARRTAERLGAHDDSPIAPRRLRVTPPPPPPPPSSAAATARDWIVDPAPTPPEHTLDAAWRWTEPDPRDALVPPPPEYRSERRTIGRATKGYGPPPVDLLSRGAADAPDPAIERRLADKAEHLQRVLNEYGVRGDVIDVSPGPVVSQFELEPGPGVKVARVVGLADDIARAMSSVSARIAPIPGKNVIGVELPNPRREVVPLRRLIEEPAFNAASGGLPVAVGVDLTGAPAIIDLADAPHLLIAGATGSGKSVAVNALLISLLYRFNPTELRLLLIDPKRLELSQYNGGPHLLSPVVSDPKEAIAALRWAVREMERRYDVMSTLGVRGLDGYNDRAAALRRAGGLFEIPTEIGRDPTTGGPLRDIERVTPDPMARIVVVIDEMSDLMMAAGKEIEHCVLRLAQMGRACGIHLVAATQRPSVDVITGLIKANFPARISLQTASAADSKTILDRPGAERLLGKGDMLFSPGGGRLERLHGAYISDGEVIAVAEHLRRFGPAEGQVSFRDGAEADLFGPETGDDEGGDDDYYERAKRIVLAEKRASASFLQRRLSIGYNRASRLIEQMERDGVVSPLTPSGKREVLGPAGPTAAAK